MVKSKKKFLFLILCFFTSFFSSVYTEDIFPQKTKSISECIVNLIALLDHECASKRIWASDQLVLLGGQAHKKIMEQYPLAGYRARREMVSILAKNLTPESKEYLLNCIFDIDYGVRNRVSLALVGLCDKDKELLSKIKSLSHKNPEIAKSIQILIKTIVYKKVENELGDLVSPQGGFGFYEGQFQKMLYLQEDAIDPLLEIFVNKDYLFVNIEQQEKEWNAYTIRYLAGEAIAQFEPWMKQKKIKVINALTNMAMNSADSKEEQLREIAMTALYFLGVKQYLQERIAESQMNIKHYEDIIASQKFFVDEYKHKLAESYSELGMIYLRIREGKTGIEMLKKAISLDPRNGLVYYNLACAYSCLNQIEDALDTLEEAVIRGYNDFQWMLKDGDLRNLHNQKRFQEIIKKLQDKAAGN
ncbi:MAG: tetratricopeptide repeat protein [Candidatus Brocadiae bacterium]|nr:tetratricopeptide repeat protein [Candidatus Brocadiia bacterium]